MPSDLLREIILIIQIWLLFNWLQSWQQWPESKKNEGKAEEEEAKKEGGGVRGLDQKTGV